MQSFKRVLAQITLTLQNVNLHTKLRFLSLPFCIPIVQQTEGYFHNSVANYASFSNKTVLFTMNKIREEQNLAIFKAKMKCIAYSAQFGIIF